MWQNPLLSLFRIGIVLVILFSTCCIPFICSTRDETLVAVLGIACLVLVSLPVLLRQDYDLFEPLTLIVLMVIFGVTLKLMYVIKVQHDSYYAILRLLDWSSPAVFLRPLTIVTAGWCCFCIGYSIPTRGKVTELIYLPMIQRWNQQRLSLVLVCIFAFSLLSLLVFMSQAGITLNSLESLTAKRFLQEEGSNTVRIFDPMYYMYRGAAFFKFVTYFALAWMVLRKDKISSLTGALFLCSLLLTIFVSFVINNRAGIVLVLIDCMVIAHFLYGEIRLRTIAVTAAVGFMLIVPALISRAGASAGIGQVIETTLAGRDMLDITKTCHIINAVPDKIDYVYGQTLYGWLLAPIPTSIWPDKPMWAERTEYLLQHVFHIRNTPSGIPPGLPAELYWNFGLLGTLIGLGLAGLLLRHLYLAFEPHKQNPTSVLIYTMIITRFGMFGFGDGPGIGIIKTVLDLGPMFLIFALVGIVGPNQTEEDESQADSHLDDEEDDEDEDQEDYEQEDHDEDEDDDDEDDDDEDEYEDEEDEEDEEDRKRFVK
jgi:oligosaccharide repeat unit polymerase